MMMTTTMTTTMTKTQTGPSGSVFFGRSGGSASVGEARQTETRKKREKPKRFGSGLKQGAGGSASPLAVAGGGTGKTPGFGQISPPARPKRFVLKDWKKEVWRWLALI